jgi:hypothetical protein
LEIFRCRIEVLSLDSVLTVNIALIPSKSREDGFSRPPWRF